MHELVMPPDKKSNISKSFLDIFNHIIETEGPGRIFGLLKEPTKDELKFLIYNYGNKFGVIRNSNGNWSMIEGNTKEICVPADLENAADIIAHNHLIFSMPAGHDAFLAIKQKRKDFIISDVGIVYYTGIKKHPATGINWCPEDQAEVDQLEMSVWEEHWKEVLNVPENIRIKIFNQLYKEFLEKMGVVVIQKLWQELPKKDSLSSFAKEISSR